MCGGIVPWLEYQEELAGLSPRVRGNRRGSGATVSRTGSIPACAGESRCAVSSRRADGVYPRVCGGINAPPVQTAAMAGLSPRVRGNHVTVRFGSGYHRSIPACAGESSVSPTAAAKRTVYPRVCGGIPSVTRRLANDTGLSPRVRGNPEPAVHAGYAVRSIPACAGESFSA